MSNLPRLGIKKALEKRIIDMNIRYINGAFTTGVKKEIQASISDMSEDYERIGLQSKLSCVLGVTINIFSEINETGVHQAVYDLIQMKPSDADMTQFKLSKIYPSSSFTSYDSEASNGAVSAQVVLTFEYIM